MASRGNGNNRGRGRGFRGGRPWRGHNSPRGRGSQTPRGGRGGAQTSYSNLDVIDVDIQRYTDENVGFNLPPQRGRGRGRGGRGGRGWRGNPIQNFKTFISGKGKPPPPRREDINDCPGRASPSGRGSVRKVSRGLGMRNFVPRGDVPLSQLLSLDRPFLRPIAFVPAQLTPVLFQNEEEIIEVHETEEPEDHVPTADRVARVFGQTQPTQSSQPSFLYSAEDDLFAGGTDSEPMVTVDFNSLSKLIDDVTPLSCEREILQEISHLSTVDQATNITNVVKDFLSSKNDAGEGEEPTSEVASQTAEVSQSRTHLETSPRTVTTTVRTNEEATISVEAAPPEEPLFVIDPMPATNPDRHESVAFTRSEPFAHPLGSTEQDDEVIVYVAPHPRSGRATPLTTTSNQTPQRNATPSLPNVNSSTSAPHSLPGPSFESMSFSFRSLSTATESNRQQTASPRSRRLTKRDRQVARTKVRTRVRGFGAYGAMLEEAHLHEGEEVGSRRYGSDIEWGSGDEVEQVSSSLGAMDIDSDVDVVAMARFAKGISKGDMDYTRIDDIDDAEKLRLEDEEDEEDDNKGSSGDDSEADEAINAEEELLSAEEFEFDDNGLEADEDDEDEESSDEDETPKRSFQARLDRLRSAAKGKAKDTSQKTDTNALELGLDARLSNARVKGKAKASSDEDDEDDDVEEEDDDDYDRYRGRLSWADRDEVFLAEIHAMFDAGRNMLSGRDRKQKKTIFNAIHNGDFGLEQANKKSDHGNNILVDLRREWEADRAKKAENKRKRALAKLEVAMDPFAPHTGGKKQRKALLRASRLTAEAEREASSSSKAPLVDFPGLAIRMREFVFNISGPSQMSLPPMDKTARKKVHEIALTMNLKSVSKGRGEARYTTLIRTSRTGTRIDERKLDRLMRTGRNWEGSARGGGAAVQKHREGDEVGKAAPKIGDENIGFKMLAMMGWAEGDTIGVSGGLDAPITAIIKHSKLGLGAAREGKNERKINQ